MMLLLLLKIALMAVSLAGLCALVKAGLGVDGASAPLIAVSAATTALMLGGMAGALYGVWLVLFAAGLAGFVWQVILRRRRVDIAPAAALLAALVYALARYRGAYLTDNDSISHWAMAAKYLLRENRFPDASTQLIFFQSYPLGTAAYLYGMCRAVRGGDAAWLIAQFLLYIIALLPTMGLVRENKILGWGILAATAAVILCYDCFPAAILTEGALICLCVGGVTLAARWGGDRRGLWAALPVAVMLVFVKHSGIFFALMIAIALGWRARGSGAGKRPGLKAFALILAASVGAFLLWQLHVKLAYPAAGASKHAVSLSRFAHSLREKGLRTALRVGRRMLLRLLRPAWLDVAAAVVCAAVAAAVAVLARRDEAARSLWPRQIVRGALAFIAAFAAWVALMYLMYLFSMSSAEALQLASFERYLRTLLACGVGGAGVLAAAWFGREGHKLSRRATALGLCAALAAGAGLCALAGRDAANRETLFDTPAERQVLTYLQTHDIPEGERYLVYASYDACPVSVAHYIVKYHLYSADITLVVKGISKEGYDPEAYYTFSNIAAHQADVAPVASLDDLLDDQAGQRDVLLVFDPEGGFEAALQAFEARNPGGMRVEKCYE